MTLKKYPRFTGVKGYPIPRNVDYVINRYETWRGDTAQKLPLKANTSTEIKHELVELWKKLSLGQKRATERGAQERASPPSNDYIDFCNVRWVRLDELLEALKP